MVVINFVISELHSFVIRKGGTVQYLCLVLQKCKYIHRSSCFMFLDVTFIVTLNLLCLIPVLFTLQDFLLFNISIQ